MFRQRTGLILLGSLLVALSAAAQTNPCTSTSGTTGVLGPTQIYIQMADFATLQADGTPLVQEVHVKFFLQGVNPSTGTPVQTSVLLRSALTLASGTTDCYGAALPAVPMAPGSVYFAVATEKGAGGESGISPASNPFGLAGTPSVPVLVRLLRSGS